MTVNGSTQEGILDAVVVGAGFAGMYLVHRLRQEGFSFRAFEAGTDVGGTWYWNRYPGARCDVESVYYSYYFDRSLVDGWDWSERYATQPEILRYLNWVADELSLRPHIDFSTRVVGAEWDDANCLWTVRTDAGETVRCRFFIPASGALSAAQVPDLPGLADFEGPVLHTGSWPHEPVELGGLRVGVIGTGSSGIQSIPEIARSAAHVTVFQRTPNYSLPARNRPLYRDEILEPRRRYDEFREIFGRTPQAMMPTLGHQSARDVTDARRREMLEVEWKRGGVGLLSLFNDFTRDVGANDFVAEFVREKIRMIVDDPATAEKLAPTGYPIGAKRIVLDSDYFATFNLPHVDLVDILAEPLEAITATGVRSSARSVEIDVLVLATGYDAITGPLTRMGIRGRDGIALEDVWRSGPLNYLGLAVAGFPNLFTITGPGSPSVLVNVVRAIEQHVDWVMDCLLRLREDGVEVIEARAETQREWVETVNAVAEATLFVKADSWYLGANIPGKPRVFLPYAGGLLAYRQACDAAAADGYRGFRLGARVLAG